METVGRGKGGTSGADWDERGDLIIYKGGRVGRIHRQTRQNVLLWGEGTRIGTPGLPRRGFANKGRGGPIRQHTDLMEEGSLANLITSVGLWMDRFIFTRVR